MIQIFNSKGYRLDALRETLGVITLRLKGESFGAETTQLDSWDRIFSLLIQHMKLTTSYGLVRKDHSHFQGA